MKSTNPPEVKLLDRENKPTILENPDLHSHSLDTYSHDNFKINLGKLGWDEVLPQMNN